MPESTADRDLLAPLSPAGESVEGPLRKAQYFTPTRTTGSYIAVVAAMRRSAIGSGGGTTRRSARPTGELRGLVFVEGVRQGRHHRLGDAADQLSVGGAGFAGVRAAALSAQGVVFLV